MRIGSLAVALAALTASTASAQPVTEPACDRACLEGYVDRYLDAMLANEASPELFARGTKFTENGVRLPLGNEGLWYGMSGEGSYEFYVPDVETQQVAFIGTVLEDAANAGANTGEGSLVAIALRLKVENELITEVEQLAIRPETSLGDDADEDQTDEDDDDFPPTGEAVDAMGEPHPVYREVIPEAERPSREELVETANYYFTALARDDGQGYYPFTDDCERFENGVQTTNTDCKAQFENGQWIDVVSRIRDRRFVAVDRERGIVFTFAFFDHEQINWTWQLAELFKIEDGLIRRVEAVFQRAPYGTPSGWSTYEQAMSESIQSVR